MTELLKLYHQGAILAHLRLPMEATTFVLSLEKYVNAAIIQWHRIQAGLVEQDRAIKEEWAILQAEEGWPDPRLSHQLQVQTFADIHSFFVYGHKVFILLRGIVSADGGADLKALWDEGQAVLAPFKKFRHHLEHLDRRIQEGYSKQTQLIDLGVILNKEMYSFFGDLFDLGPGSLASVTQLYDRFLKVVADRPRIPAEELLPGPESDA